MANKPPECLHCQKPTSVHYKEISDGVTCSKDMCKDCPILSGKLYESRQSLSESLYAKDLTTLQCTNCKTTGDDVFMGKPLGCCECYDVFAVLLRNRLIEEENLYPFIPNESTSCKPTAFHKGKTPGSFSPKLETQKLITLCAALDIALENEHYEQAALIRDQINALKGKDGLKKD